MGKVALSYSEADKKGETLIEWPWHYWFIKQMHFNGKRIKLEKVLPHWLSYHWGLWQSLECCLLSVKALFNCCVIGKIIEMLV